MKRQRILNILIWVVFIGLAAVIACGFCRVIQKIDQMPKGGMSRLPEGELIASYPSPDGTHIVNAYLCEAGATVSDSVRAEVVTGDTTRNIYWQYKENACEIQWLSEDVVSINGKRINVIDGSYDWRRIIK